MDRKLSIGIHICVYMCIYIYAEDCPYFLLFSLDLSRSTNNTIIIVRSLEFCHFLSNCYDNQCCLFDVRVFSLTSCHFMEKNTHTFCSIHLCCYWCGVDSFALLFSLHQLGLIFRILFCSPYLVCQKASQIFSLCFVIF